MTNILYPYQFHEKLKLEETVLDNVYDSMLGLGYTKARASKAALLHDSWIHGKDVATLAGSKRTFYEYREMLLKVGVDIQQKCNISRITLRANKFTWEPVEPPEWYKRPCPSARNHLRVA